MRSYFPIIILSLFFCSNTNFAQKPIWKDIFLDDDINLTKLESDTIGFIWGLSKNGFYQYDGFKPTKKISTHNGISNFTSIGKDQNQNFLIGNNEGKLIQYNPYSDKILKTIEDRIQTPITFLDCKDIDNNCLLLSYGNGISWTNQGIDTLLTIDNLLISNEVYATVAYTNKIILATDQGIQIISRNGERLSSQILNKNNGLGDVIITNILEINDKLYASNYDSQVYEIDNSTLEISTYDLPFKSKVNGLKMIGTDRLMVITSKGLFEREGNLWFEKSPTSNSNEILDITTDEENNIWACSAGNKLSKAHLGFQQTVNTIEKSRAILKIDNQFWIGSSDGLFIVDGMDKVKLLDNNVTCLKSLGEDILVGTYSSGIIILNKQGQIIGSIDGWENNPNQSVLYLYPKANLLYISSLTGVIKVKISKKDGLYSSSSYQNLNKQLGPGYIYQILEDDGVLYFATDRQGLKILRQDSLHHITHFTDGSALGSIYSMTKCDAGRIWFSTSVGYVGYEKDGIVYSLDNERISQDPYTSLITSPDQRIVMVRNNSIDVYDPSTDHFLHFNDIRQTEEEALFLNGFAQEEDAIFLAQPNSVLKIDGFQNQKIYPECIINKVMVNLIDVENESSFSEDQNNLEFKYSTAWLTDPERITYQYKLEGFENKWRNTRDQRAIYPMLRPGKYTFRIKASVDGKFGHDAETTYPFRIKQSFYKSWWFITLVLLLIGGIIRKWRNERRKVKLQKEDLNKKRIEAQLISLQSQLNPHFLFNSFNTLIGLIEENPAKGITFTEKLTDFYRTILEAGKNDMIPLKEEVRVLDTYIHLIKERFGDQLHIRPKWEDMSPYKIPPLTLQLLIENAVKHNTVSTKNPLFIDLVQSGNKITITNKIKPKIGNSKGTGIGLENIKKRHTLNNLRPPKIEQNDENFIVTIYLNKEE